VILVDTSVWVDHLRRGDPLLSERLATAQVLVHPFVIGEIALGHLRQRRLVLSMLQDLPRAVVATEWEVLDFINRHALYGCGIGYVDAHLLAAVRLSAAAGLWTRDKRLGEAARQLNLTADPPGPAVA
jgi:predicted nucleic acid-binding protein